MNWYESLDPLLKTFWLVAIPVSLIFTFQTIMTFMGADASDGVDADFDGNLEDTSAPFQLFSLRNLINFLLGFSWAGISFYTTIESKLFLILFALGIGVVFVLMFFLIMQQLQRLSENNSFNLINTINKTAEVYLSIPPKMSGRGKVMISVNGSYHELPAMTENEKIPTGKVVRIIKIDASNNLIVESL